ncbi:unnamed protein product, partial [Onchocerca ochengi]|uniref:Uncharacterized protein n=1 Tax=Onchocerca ochengi TaxID=42157 RepID=A0A182ESP4_ONCOC
MWRIHGPPWRAEMPKISGVRGSAYRSSFSVGDLRKSQRGSGD